MSAFLKKYWWLVIGGVGAWMVLRKKDVPAPILPGENPLPGGGVGQQQVSQALVDQIKYYATAEAVHKGWSGNVTVSVDANAIRVVFVPSAGGAGTQVATMPDAQSALHAAMAKNLW